MSRTRSGLPPHMRTNLFAAAADLYRASQKDSNRQPVKWHEAMEQVRRERAAFRPSPGKHRSDTNKSRVAINHSCEAYEDDATRQQRHDDDGNDDGPRFALVRYTSGKAGPREFCRRVRRRRVATRSAPVPAAPSQPRGRNFSVSSSPSPNTAFVDHEAKMPEEEKAMTDEVNDILSITGFGDLFRTYKDRATAIAMLR